MKFEKMTCRFISAKLSREWTDAIGSDSEETFFSAAYHVMSERIWGGEAFLAVIESNGNRLVWPYVLHGIPGAPGYWDVNAAYGFEGPLVKMASAGDDASFVNDALDYLMLRWREMGVVSAFTRFSPFHANEKPVERWLQASPHVQGAVEETGHIVATDATKTAEERWCELRDSFKRTIRKGEKRGWQCEYDPNWERLDDFLAIYESIGVRNDFSARHRLTKQDFLAIRNNLSSNAMLFHVKDGDRVAASGLCVTSGGVLHLMFGGPHSDYLPLGAYKFLLKYHADWSAERSLRYVNLGGGRGGSDADSLFQFKCGFSSFQLPFCIGRLIVNSEKYNQLTEEVTRQQLAKGLRPTPHFFPAYRNPAEPVEIEAEVEQIQEVLA
jgi:Acetyltransferase (GNAT) domain